MAGEQCWDWRDAAAAGVALQSATCLFWQRDISGEGMSQVDLRKKGECGQIGQAGSSLAGCANKMVMESIEGRDLFLFGFVSNLLV